MTIYTLSNEDVHGVCGHKFPLLHAINDNYDRSAVVEVPITVTQAPFHPTQPQEHATIPSSHCPRVGKFRDHTYCSQYYDCVLGELGTIESTEMHCDRSQAFDETTQTCVDKSHVPGCA